MIRSVFYELWENYGVQRVLGIRNGYLGLNPESGWEPIALNKELVEPIDTLGGMVLRRSDDGHAAAMADFLPARGIDILFCVGGDGTQRGAQKCVQELQYRRGAPVAVVGIPRPSTTISPSSGSLSGTRQLWRRRPRSFRVLTSKPAAR